VIIVRLINRTNSKEISLNITYNRSTKGFGGVDVAGFEILGKLNRFDFGLQWNALTEVSGIVVGDEVKIDLTTELQKA